MKIQLIKDKTQLYSLFKSNMCLYSYHIGDLHDFFFKDCLYYGLLDESTNEILEVCMIFNGLSTATVLALGSTSQFTMLLQELTEFLPDKFFCHYLQDYENSFKFRFNMTDLGLHYKMYLKNYTEIKDPSFKSIKQLNLTYKKLLEEFYKESYPNNYFEAHMLETGYYYGFFDKNILISVVGVHTFSEEYKIAVLGNIATHHKYRGKGYGFILISYLLSKLKVKIDFISLNVKSDNTNAIRLYKKLGFEFCTDYKEAFFERKL